METIVQVLWVVLQIEALLVFQLIVFTVGIKVIGALILPQSPKETTHGPRPPAREDDARSIRRN